MNLRKIIPVVAVALTLVLSSVTFGQGVYAAEKTSKTSIESNAGITGDTIITKDNVKDVLNYLGLDSSKFIATNNISANSKTYTVNELKELIVNEKSNTDKKNTFKKVKTGNSNSILTTQANGTRRLNQPFDNGDYTLTYSVYGKYSGDEWTDASSPSVSIDTDDEASTLGYTFKIASNQDNNVTWESDVITFDSYVTVNKYIGVKDVGLVFVSYQGVSTTVYFYASDYL